MSVRRVTDVNEYKKVADTIIEAFGTDLFFNYHGKYDNYTQEEAEAAIRYKMECTAWAFIRDGCVFETGDFQGVSLWLAPNQDISTWTYYRSGLWKFKYMLRANARRIWYGGYVPYTEECKKEILAEDAKNCWYCSILAVHPDARGKGYARELMEMGSRQADEAGVKCYLESSSERNARMYERFGYKVGKDMILPESEPEIRFYAMVRD